MRTGFSFSRFLAVLVKEFIQMRRDRVTFAMMVALPIVQLLLFGYAINTDPRHLPTLVDIRDSGPLTRALIAGLNNSTYFDIRGAVSGEKQADAAFAAGRATFIIVVPGNFERDVVRGEKPSVLLAADASDPTATGGAVGALNGIIEAALTDSLPGALKHLAPQAPPYDIVVHKHFNPAGVTAFNIVPGLLAIIISMTMIMITAVAIVRETERGTMETLISTPVRPAEVMLGKILPYVLVGYVQTLVFLVIALVLFAVPFEGSGWAFLAGLNLFIVVNLALGFLFSTVARNQMQAMQMSFFFILPSVLLSGFMFPFAGMPGWAQAVGSVIPATHFVRIVRKVMLKGAGMVDIVPDMTALGLIMVVITVVAMLRYRQTLD
ncbi:ABC transporter permease [Rhizobium sp. NRK18]|uniref:ABC transporter permease n=1 Tax=Rhizobium sp. NRK18 TaxID=2964667 RepID=UPI0021C3D7E0|nr:ABC transporter permease [Rhizobium sp. NRK18]MCQ2005719.1 ABC transporter permease [Rhizobium sp. NRK18]